MKFATIATVVAATAGAASASAHNHRHQHRHLKRTPVADAPAAVDTVVIYELNGKQISAADATEGLKDGEFVWAQDPLSIKLSGDKTDITKNLKPAPPAPIKASAPAPAPAPAAKASASSSASGSVSFGNGATAGLTAEFPNGQIDCSDFPSAYGALSVDYLNLGGYTGIQQPGSDIGGFSNILTVVSDSCSGGDCCSEGCYCSYACPAGYLKSQWPATQGATGQSVGGLLCKNGKLWLTNPSLSNSLCIPGSQQVKVQVENNLSQQVAVCATDYPGLEGETIPLGVQPGQTSPLAAPDSSTYYQWEGKGTTRQYYVNLPGYGVEQACQWGSPAIAIGNFAPMNFGVGITNGIAYVSLIPNTPTTTATLPYNVKIVGDDASGPCEWNASAGTYSDALGTSTTGCTISASSGTLTFVLSD